MRHIIHKQVVQLALGPGVEAFGTQHAASRWYWEVLAPLLERAFDELAGEGVVIRMDRLVLDLGTMSAEQLSGNFPVQDLYDRIMAQLRKLVNGEDRDSLPERMSQRESVLAQWWYYMEKGRLPWNAEIVDAGWWRMVLETLSVDYEAVSRLRRALEWASFRQRVSRQHPDEFLETLTGILTGVKQESLSRSVEEACVLSSWLEKEGRQAAGKMDETQASKGRLYSGGRQEGRLFATHLDRWMEAHATLLSKPESGRKAVVWEEVLLGAARRPAEWKASGAVTQLSRWVSESEEIQLLLEESGYESPLMRRVGRRWSERFSSPAGDDGGFETKKEEPGDPVAPVKDREQDMAAPTAPMERVREVGRREERADDGVEGSAKRGDETKEDVQTEIPEGGVVESAAAGIAREMRDRGEEETEGDEARILEEGRMLPVSGRPENAEERLFDRSQVEEEGLFGRFAGVVLLHPFLSTFFARCGLAERGAFIDANARQQAVYLLYYLATGEKEGPEHELLFPKLFCGCDLEAPLVVREEQPESSYAEADELLPMVLQRWEKLQHSSVAALREGFLQRMGKLVNRGERLVLVMESSAIDVLLDYLPWNLSIVKLPWIQELIYVEWR